MEENDAKLEVLGPCFNEATIRHLHTLQSGRGFTLPLLHTSTHPLSTPQSSRAPLRSVSSTAGPPVWSKCGVSVEEVWRKCVSQSFSTILTLLPSVRSYPPCQLTSSLMASSASPCDRASISSTQSPQQPEGEEKRGKHRLHSSTQPRSSTPHIWISLLHT